MPVGCGLVALLGGVVLLATNMDIAYIGLAGWLALLVALWIGYEIPAKRAASQVEPSLQSPSERIT